MNFSLYFFDIFWYFRGLLAWIQYDDSWINIYGTYGFSIRVNLIYAYLFVANGDYLILIDDWLTYIVCKVLKADIFIWFDFIDDPIKDVDKTND